MLEIHIILWLSVNTLLKSTATLMQDQHFATTTKGANISNSL